MFGFYSWQYNGTHGAIERDLIVVNEVLYKNKKVEKVAKEFETEKGNILGAIDRYLNGELNKGIDEFNEQFKCNIEKRIVKENADGEH